MSRYTSDASSKPRLAPDELPCCIGVLIEGRIGPAGIATGAGGLGEISLDCQSFMIVLKLVARHLAGVTTMMTHPRPTAMKFRDKLELLMGERGGMSQADVRRMVGHAYGNHAVARWLGRVPSKVNGKPDESNSRPGGNDFLKLADHFDVDLRWLMDDAMGLRERTRGDNTDLAKIRKLSRREQSDMLELHWKAGATPDAGL